MYHTAKSVFRESTVVWYLYPKCVTKFGKHKLKTGLQNIQTYTVSFFCFVFSMECKTALITFQDHRRSF